jgi:hypothetical protein
MPDPEVKKPDQKGNQKTLKTAKQSKGQTLFWHGRTKGCNLSLLFILYYL